ncbi:MAG: hypothetical protein HY752_06945, partial [Nitrospirae bacterium]|nr:hypothetical protein [Nitrospirota bacterium]
ETEREKIQYLRDYLWSSLPGYISNREKEEFIDYAMVLEEYGGDNHREGTEKGSKVQKRGQVFNLAILL